MSNTKFIKVDYEEIWKDVEGFEDFYKVSSFGNVQSKDRSVITKTGKVMFFKGKKLFLSLNGSGYNTVCIKIRSLGISKSMTVHKLVATAFLTKKSTDTEINHIDGVKTNNSVENLEWCNHTHNIRHAFKTGLFTPKSAFIYPNSQLNKEQILEIRELFKTSDKKLTEIAKMYNVSREIISKLKNGRTYNNL